MEAHAWELQDLDERIPGSKAYKWVHMSLQAIVQAIHDMVKPPPKVKEEKETPEAEENTSSEAKEVDQAIKMTKMAENECKKTGTKWRHRKIFTKKMKSSQIGEHFKLGEQKRRFCSTILFIGRPMRNLDTAGRFPYISSTKNYFKQNVAT